MLADAFGSIDALMAASEDQIDAVPGIGPEIAATVREWFDEEENRQLIEKLRAAGSAWRTSGGSRRPRRDRSTGSRWCSPAAWRG